MAGPESDDGAAPQAGVLEGQNPIEYMPSNPIQLFIVQASIIIIFCRLLHYPLQKLGQPRVIAEVVGGILLGPSVMMRIPGFQDSIFPEDSMPVLNNVANLGLLLFLFLVALELDVRLFSSNWKVALSVGMAGMIMPFGLGCGIAWGLYNEFHVDAEEEPINFGVYALFVGTALAITAFPVLCRILSELKLLSSSVGVIVLAAGIGNDVTGWVLLALCVALVNNASGLAALWALLCCVGWTLFLTFIVRPALLWLLRRNGSLQNGPSQGMVALTMLLTLASAWFTSIIGVHPIFGAFLAGLICPHHGGFAIKLTEKIEDLVSVLFLPLFFALSGLNTNLGLLHDGIAWAYVVGVTAIAFAGKIIGGTLAARCCRLVWRESLTIGVLMSCKGLVELIVLNIGLQAGILSQQTFTIFVVMAVVTTVATTPLTKVLFPPWYQQKLDKWKRGEIDWDGTPLQSAGLDSGSIAKLEATEVKKLLVQIRLDSLPGIFTLITLLGRADDQAPSSADSQGETEKSTGEIDVSRGALSPKRPLEVHGLRMLELTDRNSSVMQVTEEENAQKDPIVSAFTTFTQLQSFSVSGRLAVVPTASYAETLISHASEVSSDLTLIPWGEYGSISEDLSTPYEVSPADRFSNKVHLEFIEHSFKQATCNTAVFVNQGLGGLRHDKPRLSRTVSALSIRSFRDRDTLQPAANKGHHVFLPFFGGVDDRVALRMVLRMAKNKEVIATVVHFTITDAAGGDGTSSGGQGEEEITPEDAGLLATLRASLPADLEGRVMFGDETVSKADALGNVEQCARRLVGQSPRNAGDIVVVARRHPLLDGYTHQVDLKRAVGAVAEKVIKSQDVKATVLVFQAAGHGLA